MTLAAGSMTLTSGELVKGLLEYAVAGFTIPRTNMVAGMPPCTSGRHSYPYGLIDANRVITR